MSKAETTYAADGKKDAWVGEVRRLIASVVEWAKDQAWLIDEHEITITESLYGTYSVPTLLLRTPQLKLAVEPVGLDIENAEGRIDIEAFPSLHRFVLIRKEGEWRLMTDSMVEWPRDWGKETFLEIVNALGKAP